MATQTEQTGKTSMTLTDQQMILIICLIPFAGLLYCGLVIGLMLSFPLLRTHPLTAGGTAALLPLIIGATIWIGASAQAYQVQKDHSLEK